MSIKNYYQVLGVDSDVSQEEIKRAFRRLALRYHPDRNPDDQKQAEERFKEINEAYEVLGDSSKRQRYDFLIAGRGQRRVFIEKDLFGRGYSNRDIEELIKELAAFDIAFGDGRAGKHGGCRRGRGRRCQRFSGEWPDYGANVNGNNR